MALRILNAAQVAQLLPMSECIDVMAEAMQATSRGAVAIPQRMAMPLIDGSGALYLMPGSTLRPPLYGAKLISLHPRNTAQGRPVIQGFVVLFEHDTGVPVALVEGAQLTLLRTAAASGLATRTLARRAASTHGIFGAGLQAAAHARAIASVRKIARVVIWARNHDKAKTLAAELSDELDSEVMATADPAVAGACDIVTTVTASSEPVLQGAWLRPGAHLNLVGAHSPATRESDDEAVRSSRIYVDLLQSAMNEAGDLLLPMQAGIIDRGAIVAELGQVLADAAPGRDDDSQITLYKSLGIVAQDLAAAAYVYRQAVALDVGTVVAF